MTMNEIRVRDIDPRPRSPYWFGTTTREQFDSLIQSLLSLSISRPNSWVVQMARCRINVCMRVCV